MAAVSDFDLTPAVSDGAAVVDAVTSAPPDVPRPGMKLPRTTYVWLALTLLLLLGGNLLERGTDKRPKAAGTSGLSAQEFEGYQAAETSARMAFSAARQEKRRGKAGPDVLSDSPLSLENQRKKTFEEAIKQYQKLLPKTTSPNLPRRLMVLRHAAGKPFEGTLVSRDLARDLQDDKISPAQIAEEQSLWRELYAHGPKSALSTVAGVERIRAMKLRFFEARALADWYGKRDDWVNQLKQEARFNDLVVSYQAKSIGVGVAVFLMALLGVFVLLFFAVAAISRHWHYVGRVATRPRRLGYGDLVDVFAFFLAALFCIRPLSYLVKPLLQDPSLVTVLSVTTVAYWIPPIAAFVYLRRVMRERGATFADIGLHLSQLWPDVRYGMLAFCATLPLTFALGALSHYLFKDNTQVTPNPILPMIAAGTGVWERVLIFLLASIAAPICEEFLFRGVLFSGLRAKFGPILSIALSALAFACVHPMQDWIPIFGLGVALATVREMRQSLVPGMVIHFLQNTQSFLLLSLLFGQ